jgi:hypothetical protein
MGLCFPQEWHYLDTDGRPGAVASAATALAKQDTPSPSPSNPSPPQETTVVDGPLFPGLSRNPQPAESRPQCAKGHSEQLVRQGHEVTLFASGDSKTKATLQAPCARALRLDTQCRDPLPYHFIALHRLAQSTDEFDIIHFHTDYLHFPLFVRHWGKTLWRRERVLMRDSVEQVGFLNS